MTEKILPKLSKEDKLSTLGDMIKNIEDLPQDAMLTYLNHYDLLSVLLLVKSLCEGD